MLLDALNRVYQCPGYRWAYTGRCVIECCVIESCDGALSLELLQFGGFYHAAAQNPYVSPQDCNNNPATYQCIWYNDVWMWAPTTPITVRSSFCCGTVVTPIMRLSLLVRLSQTTPWKKANVRNGVAPPARYGHAAGLVNGETMVIFGGSGAGGALNDLWSFDISMNTWKQLQPGTRPCDSLTVCLRVVGSR